MIVDASRSRLGLGTCVGSAIRQIVDARVLLTATVPQPCPEVACWVRWRLLLWLRSRSVSNQPAGTITRRAMAQTKPDSSRAIAVAINIPATVHALAADAGSDDSKHLPAGAGQGRKDFGISQYSGPCPPVGDHARHYKITVHAVKVARLPLENTTSGVEVSAQLRSKTLATAKIVGRYERRN